MHYTISTKIHCIIIQFLVFMEYGVFVVFFVTIFFSHKCNCVNLNWSKCLHINDKGACMVHVLLQVGFAYMEIIILYIGSSIVLLFFCTTCKFDLIRSMLCSWANLYFIYYIKFAWLTIYITRKWLKSTHIQQ